METAETIAFKSLAALEFPQGKIPKENIVIDPRFGKGYLNRPIQVSKDIRIHIEDFTLYGAGAVRLEVIPLCSSSVFFCTAFSYLSRVSECRPSPLSTSRMSWVETTEYATKMIEIMRAQPIRTIVVEAKETLLDLDRRAILKKLHKADAVLPDQSGMPVEKSLDLELRMAAGQAYQAAKYFSGDLLYLKAKALELIALHMRHLGGVSEIKSTGKTGDNFSDQVAAVTCILKEEMANPPGARELAARVGMNHNQLVSAFRERLGLTPFSYLRRIRLNRAGDLLAEGKCNVTEAAFLVGYDSLSHFTKAFKAQFGMAPKSWAKGKSAGRSESA